MIYLVGASYQNAELYRGLAGLNPQEARIVSTPELLRGMHGARVIVLLPASSYRPGYWDRFHEALEVARAVVQYDDTDRLLGDCTCPCPTPIPADAGSLPLPVWGVWSTLNHPRRQTPGNRGPVPGARARVSRHDRSYRSQRPHSGCG